MATIRTALRMNGTPYWRSDWFDRKNLLSRMP